MFEAAGLLGSEQFDALSLKGRLLKDQALKSTGARRKQLFQQAEAAYLRAASGRRATYPLINAATIAFLNGDVDRSGVLARCTLELLASGDHEPETNYWLGATRAEAELLLGHVDQSKVALEQAVAGTPDAWEDHASTIRQLETILAHAGQTHQLFEHLRPPTSLHFSGAMDPAADEKQVRENVASMLDRIRPGFAFGALAAGSDILIAEMVVARGALLHVVLPVSIDVFRDVSVAPFGKNWVDRFERLLGVAEIVDVIDETATLSTASVALAEEVAMGLAIRRARTLTSTATALRLRRLEDAASPTELLWRRLGLPAYGLTIDSASSSRLARLPTAEKRATLASERQFTRASGRSADRSQRCVNGIWLMDVENLEEAVERAIASLRKAPDIGLGLFYHVVEHGSAASDQADIAGILARIAPPGVICAAHPGALAIELCAPDHRFEMAGEIASRFGDIPISQYSVSEDES